MKYKSFLLLAAVFFVRALDGASMGVVVDRYSRKKILEFRQFSSMDAINKTLEARVSNMAMDEDLHEVRFINCVRVKDCRPWAKFFRWDLVPQVDSVSIMLQDRRPAAFTLRELWFDLPADRAIKTLSLCGATGAGQLASLTNTEEDRERDVTRMVFSMPPGLETLILDRCFAHAKKCFEFECLGRVDGVGSIIIRNSSLSFMFKSPCQQLRFENASEFFERIRPHLWRGVVPERITMDKPYDESSAEQEPGARVDNEDEQEQRDSAATQASPPAFLDDFAAAWQEWLEGCEGEAGL